ncbi:MAG: hypothetical protein KatS3mg115_0444 [Candidatus Poribacteria bacterium]|nr:MAG: hypothetical protein KatS3mg115_0444 [Candidatus Poribacteria bacterium]
MVREDRWIAQLERRRVIEDPRPGGPEEEETGPSRPDPERSTRERLLRRMKQVDRDQSKRYRQRTGE